MKQAHSRKRYFVISLLCLLAFIIHILLKRAEPAFIAQASNYANTAFTDLVNGSILKIAEEKQFNDFYEIVFNENNEVMLLRADTAKINNMVSELMIEIQSSLNSDYPAFAYIPAGALFKYNLLSMSGPLIPIKITPISIVNSTYSEEFKAVGINQIRYRIYLNITVDMLYTGYFLHETERIEMTMPISDTVYSGDVPQYYGEQWDPME